MQTPLYGLAIRVSRKSIRSVAVNCHNHGSCSVQERQTALGNYDLSSQAEPHF